MSLDKIEDGEHTCETQQKINGGTRGLVFRSVSHRFVAGAIRSFSPGEAKPKPEKDANAAPVSPLA